ncbi:MAG: tetratricopeptide repeat protein [Rhodospirillales bacterium]|nr:tetratricopeptide repeat protein [Rhodospirillales bacterium]
MVMIGRIAGALCLALLVMGATGAANGEAKRRANEGAKTESLKYQNCMALVQEKPEEAYRMASTWGEEGGGRPARHCAAAAMIGMGMPAEAAQRLEDLAREKGLKKPGMRGNLLGQAASAWMIAGKPETAYALQTRALKLRPRDVELLIDRSVSLASLKKWWEAIDDLNQALDIDPGRTQALVFRASAYRRLKQPELAADDIERALAIDPTHLDGLLESGNIRSEAGDRDSARHDWMKIIKMAPWSPSAETARRNLEKIDVKSR